MKYPTDSLRSEPFPLHCWWGFSDGFSGWYAISNRDKCTDFCFWEVTLHDRTNIIDFDYSLYDANNTADPHQTTSLLGEPNSYWNASLWTCALNAGDDGTTWTNVDSKLTEPEYFGPTFPYIQCNRGANEVMKNDADKVVKSQAFWAVLLVFLALGIMAQIVVAWRRRSNHTKLIVPHSNCTNTDQLAKEAAEEEKLSRRQSLSFSQSSLEHNLKEVSPSNIDMDACIEDAPQDMEQSRVTITIPHSDISQSEAKADPKCSSIEEAVLSEEPPKICSRRQRRKRCCITALLVVLDVLLLAGLILVIFNLAELSGTSNLSEGASKLTPQCSNPNKVCKAGDYNLERPSKSPPVQEEMIPFSYLVASDAQLDWYSGESPDLGVRNVPRPCSEGDSCGACTAKVGKYSNNQMKIAIEALISEGGSNGNVIPQTLVMNGDLTAYYHPYQRSSYEKVYHNLIGLKSYFPALGNHELSHMEGATYSTDQWVGRLYCNAAHSIGYIRGGFCGSIPNFDSDRVVRYDASSLAYSWEEGRYHFVHTHYHPAFEVAALNMKSSHEWLERDLNLAHKVNLTSILFVHASQGLNHAMEKVLLGKDVAAIFAGHAHRCIMRQCVGPQMLFVDEVIADGNSTNSSSSRILTEEAFDKCIPGTLGVCGGNAGGGGMSLFYVQNKSSELTLPETKLYHEINIPSHRKLCHTPRPLFVNETDNTLLCKKGVMAASTFPPDPRDGRESIPVFWSGSATYETFLKVDFYNDRFAVNVMTASEGMEGKRYVDTRDLPNAVYPYHERSDMEEVTIQL